MIKGETVTIRLRDFGAYDTYGHAVVAYSAPITVANVLVGKGQQRTEVSGGQPYAYEADVRFCFPKGFDHDLRGALVTRRGLTYEIVGNPQEYTEANLPSALPWNISADAVVHDG